MSLFSAIFGAKTQTGDGFEVLSPQAFHNAISNTKVQLVDVRTPNEFRSGTIKGAINIDIFQSDQFQKKIENLDKAQAVYIFCRSGSRSRRAARTMLKLGFARVVDLQGGFMAWKKFR